MKTRTHLARRDQCRIIGERMSLLSAPQAVKAWHHLGKAIEGLWEKDIPKFADLLKAIREAQVEAKGPHEKPNWIEPWMDRMGLIVALSGEERFQKLREFKWDMHLVSFEKQRAIKNALKERFAPTGGKDGCQSATSAVLSATEPALAPAEPTATVPSESARS